MADNTARSFRDKWVHNPELALSQTLDDRSDIFNWIIGRNGFTGRNGLCNFLKTKKRILDAGCGNGRVTALLRECSNPANTHIVAIDLVSADIAKQNLAHYDNSHVSQGSLLDDLTTLGSFDFIYCQEVLHHTADPHRAFLNLCNLLAAGGEIAIYVYKQKAPLREFTDGYVRRQIAELPYDQAMAICAQITAFGKSLAEANLKVTVPAVDILEIPAGEYDVQRLLYHFFMKCFWNGEMSFKDNSVINYEWYHPELCSKHTLPEVSGWFDEAGLEVMHQHVDFYGITVRGVKPRDDPR